MRQLLQRDAGLWCREIQVDACHHLLLVLRGLNRRYFTRSQVKRMQRLASKLAIAPPRLAEYIEALVNAPAVEAFAALHALKAEVHALVEEHLPDLDLSAARTRHASYRPT